MFFNLWKIFKKKHMNINKVIENLRPHLPENVINELPILINKFKINTEIRLAHLLGQCSHESGNFTKTIENLNYSADGLARTWGNRYAIDPKAKVKVPNALAKSLHRKPVLIASTTYANRMGNGDVESLEGWKFRGSGYLQTTGKDNFKLLSEYVGEDLVKCPELVRTKYALSSAGFYFKVNHLLSICDKGVDDAIIKTLTFRINGGYTGLKHRTSETKKFYNIIVS
jgi:putative chitinase